VFPGSAGDHPSVAAADRNFRHKLPEHRKIRIAIRILRTKLRIMSAFDLTNHGLTVAEIHRNLAPGKLYEHAIRYEKDASITDNGALVAYSGLKTGRSPKDNRVVKHPASDKDIWWGTVNIPLDPHTYDINRQRAQDYLNTRERLYCFDGFAGWDAKHRIKVRVICSRPYHALFMHTMLIRPTHDELDAFGEPDLVIYNAGAFPANRLTTGMDSTTSIDLSLEDKELVILGTEYAGEMKKGVFTVVNYFAPKRGVLSMHCSATADKATGTSFVAVWLERNRQDNPLRGPEKRSYRRRRTLLERRRNFQHRRWLLRESHQSDARK
jgi:phosphoenolpyruvate carboxykinase (ATP)